MMQDVRQRRRGTSSIIENATRSLYLLDLLLRERVGWVAILRQEGD